MIYPIETQNFFKNKLFRKHIQGIILYFLLIAVFVLQNPLKTEAQCGGEYRVLAKDDFGTGTDIFGPALAPGITSYIYDNGLPTYLCGTTPIHKQVEDGHYALVKNAGSAHAECGAFGSPYYPAWAYAPDHTGDGGYMLLCNAAGTPDIFYQNVYSGLCSSTDCRFSIWVTNICFSHGIQPKVKITLIDPTTSSIIGTQSSGLLPFPTSTPSHSLNWQQMVINFTVPAGSNSVKVVVSNEQMGNNGNDLAFDDVEFSICMPKVDISPNPATVCNGSSASFNTVNTTPAIGSDYNYLWQSDNSGTWVDIGTPVPTPIGYTTPALTAATKYRLRYANPLINISGNNNNSCSGEKVVTVDVIPSPVLTINNPVAVCSPNKVDITAASITLGSTGGGTLSYWSDALATVPLLSPSAIGVSGTYYIKSTTASGCFDIKPVAVTINALPTAAISYTGGPYTTTGTASVTQTGQAGGTYTVSPSSLSINSTTGKIDLSSGVINTTYTITYSFTDGTCSNSVTTDISIGSVPATISYPGSPYCAIGTASVTRTGPSGGNYSALPAGLSINATTGEINLATSTAGTYTVTYNYMEGSTSASTTTTVTINTQPVLTINNPVAVCSPNKVDITAASITLGSTGGGTLSYWSDALATVPLLSPSAIGVSGTYYIKSTTASGCFDIKPVAVTINALPTAAISYIGGPYTTTGTASVTQTGQAGGTYTVSPSSLSINSTTGKIDLSSGVINAIYTVTYNFTNGICSNSVTTDITIGSVPATISYPSSPYCAIGTASVTRTGPSGGSYSALPAVGLSINTTTGAIDLGASTAATYTVTYNYMDGSTPASTTATVTINALPTAAISYTGGPYITTGVATVTQTGQAGGTYTASPSSLSINSTTGEIDLSSGIINAIYTVTYNFTNGICSNSVTTDITIGSVPATISYPGSPYCAIGTASVTRTGPSGGSYSALPAGLSINTTTGAINLAASTADTYTVTYNYMEGSTPASTTATIIVNVQPVLMITNPAAVCSPGNADITSPSVTLGSMGSGTLSYWSDALVTMPLSFPSDIGADGIYYIKSTTASGCYDIKPVTVTIKNRPSVQLIDIKVPECYSYLKGSFTVLANNGCADDYTYSLAGSNQTQSSGIFLDIEPGKYSVIVKDICGCENSMDINMVVKAGDCDLLMPSAFTPNEDGKNDIFRPARYGNITSFKVQVYNRWGQVVYVGTDPAKGWDGKFKSIEQPIGIYIWVIEYLKSSRQKITQKGHVSLIR